MRAVLAAAILVLPAAAAAQTLDQQTFDQIAPVAPSSVPRDPAQGAQDGVALGGNDPLAPLPPPPPAPPPPRFQDHTPPPPR